jgi:hypothetical protein
MLRLEILCETRLHFNNVMVGNLEIIRDKYSIVRIYTNFNYDQIFIIKLFINIRWPPLWSSGQSSWLQIRRPGFDSRHYQKKK